MNTFQRIILIILTMVGVTTEMKGAIEIGDGDNNNYYETNQKASLLKDGTGTTTLQNTYDVASLEIRQGILKIDETADLGGAQVKFSGGTLEVAPNIISGAPSTINTGTLRLTTNGTLQVNATCTAILNANPQLTNILTKTGTGTFLVNGARNSSGTPITVSAGTLKVEPSGVLPTATLNIGNTGTLLLDASVAGMAPGATNINSGGTLKTSAAVPAGTNIFSGGLTFRSGAILDLGGDWGQNITVAP
jgi:autotransporter-associated beta strand protein